MRVVPSVALAGIVGFAVALAAPCPARAQAGGTSSQSQALPQLVERLRTGDERQQEWAAYRIHDLAVSELRAGRQPGAVLSSAIPALEERLVSGSDMVALACADALNPFGEDGLPSSLRAFERPNPSPRLAYSAATNITDALRWIGGVKNAKPATRQALSQAIPKLVLLTKTQENYAVRGAIEACDELAVPAIVNLLEKDEPNETKRRFAFMLGNMGVGAQAARPTLRKLALHPDRELREAAEYALKRIADGVAAASTPAGIQASAAPPDNQVVRPPTAARSNPVLAGLLQRLRTGDKAGSIEAAEGIYALALAEIQKRRRPGVALGAAIPALEEQLTLFGRSPDPLASACDRALRLFGEDAVPSYVRILLKRDANLLLFQVAANGFAASMEGVRPLKPATRQAVTQAVPTLVSAAASDVPSSVSFPFAKALEACGALAVPAIMQLLQSDETSKTKRRFVVILGNIGAGSKAAVPSLRELISHPDPDLREAAVSALKKIESAAEPQTEERNKSGRKPTARHP